MDNVPLYNEKAFLLAVAKGDSSAFKQIFDQHRRKVYYIAVRLLHSEAAAEDALQEVFLKIWLSREKLAEISNFSSYLNTITHHYLSNVLRKKAYEESYILEMLTESDDQNGEWLEQLNFNELEALFQQAISQLPAQQKKVFQLGRIEGWRHDEIAEQLGISKETVKKHMMEAVRKVREFFKNRGHAAFNIILAIFLH